MKENKKIQGDVSFKKQTCCVVRTRMNKSNNGARVVTSHSPHVILFYTMSLSSTHILLRCNASYGTKWSVNQQLDRITCAAFTRFYFSISLRDHVKYKMLVKAKRRDGISWDLGNLLIICVKLKNRSILKGT